MSLRRDGYRARAADAVLGRLLSSLPAVLLVGPRAAGKTTTARALAAEVLRLDRPADAAAVAADPDAALVGRAEPLLIDEWQEVPEILGAVKRAVDDDSRPGRFLLTGNARAPLQQSMRPGTGRVVQLPLYPLTQRELIGRADGRPFLERLIGGELLAGPRSGLTVNDYLKRAVRGGYPEVVLPNLDDASARAWHLTYPDALVSRDAHALSPRSDPLRLRQYLTALALNTAGVPAGRTLHESAGITAVTAARYDDLLASLSMAEAVPAWSSNRLKRLMRRPKRYLLDSGIAAAAARVDVSMARRDGDLLGRLLDTFVGAQLRSEVGLTLGEQRLHHLRTQDGRQEVDVLVELAGPPDVAARRARRGLRDGLRTSHGAAGLPDGRSYRRCADQLAVGRVAGVSWTSGDAVEILQHHAKFMVFVGISRQQMLSSTRVGICRHQTLGMVRIGPRTTSDVPSPPRDGHKASTNKTWRTLWAYRQPSTVMT